MANAIVAADELEQTYLNDELIAVNGVRVSQHRPIDVSQHDGSVFDTS